MISRAVTLLRLAATSLLPGVQTQSFKSQMAICFQLLDPVKDFNPEFAVEFVTINNLCYLPALFLWKCGTRTKLETGTSLQQPPRHLSKGMVETA